MPQELPQFKSQPWIVFDTIAARSLLVGENRPAFFAFGTNIPAINGRGELIFFAAGRTEVSQPWYTSTELVGQLSYGFEAWQVYLHIGFPIMPQSGDNNPSSPGAAGQFTGTTQLANAIINFGVLELELGQENQMSWPVHRFGAGGGMSAFSGSGAVLVQNGLPVGSNVMSLPEPVEIARTQNLDAKIRLAPEILELIGDNVARGVGVEIEDMVFFIADGDGTQQVTVPALPFTIQLGLIGKRVKKTQYGQLPPNA